MNMAFLAGKTYLIWRQFSPWIMLIAFIGYVAWTRPEPPKVVKPVVIVVEEGKVKRVVKRANDPANITIITDLAENLAKTMWNYTEGDKKGYSQKYLGFRQSVADLAPAEKKLSNEVKKYLLRGGYVEKESSELMINWQNTFVSRSQKDKDKWLVATEGVRTVSSAGGNKQESIKLDITVIEGGDDDAFKVWDFAYNTSSK